MKYASLDDLQDDEKLRNEYRCHQVNRREFIASTLSTGLVMAGGHSGRSRQIWAFR